MSTNNDGGPAFPNKDELGNMICGMSLRDWFAGQQTLAEFDEVQSTYNPAMAEALAGRPMPDHGWVCKTPEQWIALLQWDADWRSRLKFIRADAMLRAREGGAR